jgi:hypothetical protein
MDNPMKKLILAFSLALLIVGNHTLASEISQEQALKKVVQIFVVENKTEKVFSSGSGIIIDANKRHIATALHVIDQSRITTVNSICMSASTKMFRNDQAVIFWQKCIHMIPNMTLRSSKSTEHSTKEEGQNRSLFLKKHKSMSSCLRTSAFWRKRKWIFTWQKSLDCRVSGFWW